MFYHVEDKRGRDPDGVRGCVSSLAADVPCIEMGIPRDGAAGGW